MKEITLKQFQKLPEGSKVTITWSGGNGPHEYEVFKTPSGENIVKPWNPNSGWWYGQVGEFDKILVKKL